MGIGENIKRLREEHKLSQSEFGKIAGVSDKAVSTWENGQKTPRMGAIQKIADYFGLTKSDIIEDGNSPTKFSSLPPGCEPLPRTVKRPLLGTIACGEPITAAQNIESYVDVPEGVHCDFCLRCKGDSMIGANILDGDLVYIRIQQDVDDGEIAAVLIDDEATLKRVYKIPGRVQLRPENPSYPVLEYTGPELETIRILGKAVGYTHWF